MNLDINTCKILGCIGALLAFISLFAELVEMYVLPNALFILGVILITTSLYGLSKHYRDSTIFRKALIGSAAGIIGLVVAGIIVFTLLLPSIVPLMQIVYPGWDGNWNALPNTIPGVSMIDSNATLEALAPMWNNLLISLGIMSVFAIIATYFMRQSLNRLGEKSNIGLFGITGTVMLIGGFLTVCLIGYILLCITPLLLAIAFLKIKPQANTTQHT